MGLFWDLIAFFKHGGFFMYPILLILTTGIAIIADRLLFLKKAWIDGNILWGTIEQDIRSGKLDDAIRHCKGSEAALPKVLAAGLEKAMRKKPSKDDRDELENFIEESMLTVMPQLESRTHYLPTLANVSTLFGLLGTITGLIHAFQSIASADPAQKATMLAQGVSEAMNATAFGIIVAIPLMLFHVYILSRTIKIVDTLDAFSIKLINILTSE